MNFKIKKIELSIIKSIIIILLFSFLSSFIIYQTTPETPKTFFEFIIYEPAVFLLNYIPILLAMIMIYMVFNNAVFSVIITTFILIAMSFINRTKIFMRQEPFIPSDVTLLNEVKTIFANFDISYMIGIILGVLVFIVLIALSFIFFKHRKISKKIRVASILSTVLIAVFLNFSVYASTDYYDSLNVEGNYYYKVNHYVSKGFLYSFIHDINTLRVKKPYGYNKSFYITTEKNNSVTEFDDSKKPHIIMIMGEAFSDISENENIDFKGYKDPLKNFKKIAKSDNAISGHIVVPNFGGGTSDTEFDVLTGCSTRFIDNPLSSYSFIRTHFDAMPSLLKSLGYESVAIHPGYSWFYNRNNVYRYFGFDKTIFLEDNFEPVTQNKGMYISDEATVDTIISEFEDHIEKSNNPLFSFSVTIQNHGPYEEKYHFDGRNFNTDIEMTDHQISMLGNYFEGVKDADTELKRLVDYFEDSEEPVVIVYFGDHLPGFSTGMDIYETLEYDIKLDGTVEEYINTYKTPFLIWENDSAKDIVDIEENAKNILFPENMTISSNFLGSAFMKLLGYDYISPLWQFSNTIMESFPVITEYFYVNSENEIIDTLDENDREHINQLKGWTYYKIFDEQ